jgi:hypothetical protein
MSNKSTATVVMMGIDIGKNSFHVVGLDEHGAIMLRMTSAYGAKVAGTPGWARTGHQHGISFSGTSGRGPA